MCFYVEEFFLSGVCVLTAVKCGEEEGSNHRLQTHSFAAQP